MTSVRSPTPTVVKVPLLRSQATLRLVWYVLGLGRGGSAPGGL